MKTYRNSLPHAQGRVFSADRIWHIHCVRFYFNFLSNRWRQSFFVHTPITHRFLSNFLFASKAVHWFYILSNDKENFNFLSTWQKNWAKKIGAFWGPWALNWNFQKFALMCIWSTVHYLTVPNTAVVGHHTDCTQTPVKFVSNIVSDGLPPHVIHQPHWRGFTSHH